MRVTGTVLSGLFCWMMLSPSYGQQPTATEVYNLRERCGKLAAAAYAKDYSPSQKTATGGTEMFNYENHYSQKLNKCFYLEVGTFFEKNLRSTSMRLYDLNENKEYGHYWESFGSFKSVDCSVGEARCTSEDEFRKLAKPYLEE